MKQVEDCNTRSFSDYLGSEDQLMVPLAALSMQSTAAKRNVQLGVDVDMPHNSPSSLCGVFVEIMTYLNCNGRCEESQR